jgi:hypothetical protein
MAKRNELYKSKYLKADAIPDGVVVARIRSAGVESLKGFSGEMERKLVLYLNGGLPPYIVNVTAFDIIADFLGKDDSSDWVGEEIELYSSTVEVQGQMKPCVRVRQPDQTRMPLNGAPAKKPAAKPVRAAGDNSDLDDEIPF